MPKKLDRMINRCYNQLKGKLNRSYMFIFMTIVSPTMYLNFLYLFSNNTE